jgi:hypothetical protein
MYRNFLLNPPLLAAHEFVSKRAFRVFLLHFVKCHVFDKSARNGFQMRCDLSFFLLST